MARETGNSFRNTFTKIVSGATSAIQDVKENLTKVTDDLMETMLGISIEGICDFNERNARYMERLMNINFEEHMLNLRMTGEDAYYRGNSDNISIPALKPYYAEGRIYLDYYDAMRAAEPQGVINTRGEAYYSHNYINRNEIYNTTKNLYPDELDTGLSGAGNDYDAFMDQGIWETDGYPNSLLAKTKELFRQRKINTLISRFGTRTDGDSGSIDYTGSKKTDYGESHGRNLLTRDAEKSGRYPNYHGYNDPYCRVWTHHHQYDRLDKLIRPFETKSADGLVTSPVGPSEFHNDWASDEEHFKMKQSGKWGWKDGNEGWKRSVIDPENGMPRIAPKFGGGGSKNIHTRDCMFSIENLAWRGYSPYEFEKNLSWEQRGPLGGRIMWFPPYGVQFNETTQVNWNSSTFIGRGEDVYTYVNTVRSGTLSFLMVVDHPSIIDYATWSPDDTMSDTDVLRFFAGCEELVEWVKPTPLMPDEYLPIYQEPKPEPIKEEPKPAPEPDPEPEYEEGKIQFFVFYPNN